MHVAVFVVTIGAVCGAQEALDVTALLGQTRAGIAHVFPGTTSILRGWKGWRTVLLVPDRLGRLVSIVLEPRSPITERQAEETLQRLGVEVVPGKYFASETEHGYSDMAGPVRTVIYTVEQDRTVSRIGIYSKLADER